MSKRVILLSSKIGSEDAPVLPAVPSQCSAPPPNHHLQLLQHPVALLILHQYYPITHSLALPQRHRAPSLWLRLGPLLDTLPRVPPVCSLHMQSRCDMKPLKLARQWSLAPRWLVAWHPCSTAKASQLPHICIEGGDIPAIRSRVPNILPPGANPRRIILQVSGNDATKHPAEQIATRYDGLIRDIRTRCPLSKIILSKVPPRKGTSRTMSTINKINSSIDKFAQSFHDVYSIDVCPSSLYHFTKDCIHFNAAGLKYYAENIAKVLQNFHRGHQMVTV